MPLYTVTFVKDNGISQYHQCIVEAINEDKAFDVAVYEAKIKGIILPDNVWVRTYKHKNNGKTKIHKEI
jgi:hypothetical protein